MTTSTLAKRLHKLESAKANHHVITIFRQFTSPSGAIDHLITGATCRETGKQIARLDGESREELHQRAIRELGSDTEARRLMEVITASGDGTFTSDYQKRLQAAACGKHK